MDSSHSLCWQSETVHGGCRTSYSIIYIKYLFSRNCRLWVIWKNKEAKSSVVRRYCSCKKKLENVFTAETLRRKMRPETAKMEGCSQVITKLTSSTSILEKKKKPPDWPKRLSDGSSNKLYHMLLGCKQKTFFFAFFPAGNHVIPSFLCCFSLTDCAYTLMEVSHWLTIAQQWPYKHTEWIKFSPNKENRLGALLRPNGSPVFSISI